MLIVLICTCWVTAWSQPSKKLEAGTWRARLARADGHDIAFNFEVRDSAGRQHLFVRNAHESIPVDHVSWIGDTLHLQLPFFDSEIRALSLIHI